MERVALIVFARAPKAGTTKTRLAAVIGDHLASAFHAVCLRDLINIQAMFGAKLRSDNQRPLELDTYFFHPPEDQLAEFARAGVNLPPDIHSAVQTGDDLGQRMAHAIQTVLDGSPEGTRCLLIGSDCPLLEPDDLVAAVNALDNADVVVGPTHDGGYYMIGMAKPRPGLFTISDWGGPTVLEQTKTKAQQAGLTLAEVETLPDVDTAEDLEQVTLHPRLPKLEDREAVRLCQVLALQATNQSDKITSN